jgi:hypothetical protein
MGMDMSVEEKSKRRKMGRRGNAEIQEKYPLDSPLDCSKFPWDTR